MDCSNLNEKRRATESDAKSIGKVLQESFVNHYVTKMLELDDNNDFNRDDSIPGKAIPDIMMYKLKIGDNGETMLRSRDGHRGYEFLVEFDTKTFSYGIYYGCRGIILDGNIKEETDKFEAEWRSNICDIVCHVLDNTFINKKFEWRFLPTDNVNDNTFWPFWIPLYPDESISEVAARATRLIGNIYKKYLVGDIFNKQGKRKVTDSEIKEKDGGQGLVPSQTRFTKQVYENAVTEISKIGERHDKSEEEIQQIRSQKRAIFERFIDGAIKENVIEEDSRYEKCYKVLALDNVLFAHLLVRLYIKISGEKETEDKQGKLQRKIPWKLFIQIFLSQSDELFDNIKKSFSDSTNNRRSEGIVGKFYEEQKIAIDLLNKILSKE